MRILVCVKQIYDARLPLKTDGQRVAPAAGQPVYEISPGSRAALEWALRLKRPGGSDVTALALGGQETEAALRSSLALGADRAVHLVTGGDVALETWQMAGFVKNVVVARSIDLVLCGDGVFGPFLAQAVGWPQITRSVHLAVDEKGEIHALRLLERGDREEVSGWLPAVVTCHSTGCEPAYVSVLRLQQAANLSIERISCQESAPVAVGLAQVDIGPPKPRPRRMAAPAAGMSAAQRMNFLMGGQARGAVKDNRLVTGDPDGAAEKILQYLKERGFV
jgi:electron transfer flavoprotein beta subunit